jgi:hypothetical protein
VQIIARFFLPHVFDFKLEKKHDNVIEGVKGVNPDL